MIQVRRAAERGQSRTDWLDSRHTFSFADYRDPAHRGFRELRVINDDRVAPGTGFGTHPHANMEILTWVLDGALAHRDSMGNASTIRPGELQRMSAGTGVLHSEVNPSADEPVHFLQIWVKPNRLGLEPSYEQRRFPIDERRGRLRLIASPDGREGSVRVHQDLALYTGRFAPGEQAELALAPGRHAWVQVAVGSIDLGGQPLHEGDGAAISDEARVRLEALTPAEVLVFDLA